MNPVSFLAASAATLLVTWVLADKVKLRFYTKHRHIHHGLYGAILVPLGGYEQSGLLLGVAWALILSELKFFITNRTVSREHKNRGN